MWARTVVRAGFCMIGICSVGVVCSTAEEQRQAPSRSATRPLAHSPVRRSCQPVRTRALAGEMDELGRPPGLPVVSETE